MSTETDTTETDATDAVDDAGAPQAPEAVDGEPEADSDAQDENQGRRGVRQKLADAEAERDTLRDTLTRQRQALFTAALDGTGVDADLMAARSHTVDGFVTDDGLINTAAVGAAAREVASSYGINPARRPAPDPLVGGGEPKNATETGWGAALKSALSPG